MKTIEEVKEEHLDLTGLMCPLPVVITSEKMRKLQEGQILTVISTDPGFERDIMSWCLQTGNELIKLKKEEEIYLIVRIAFEGDKSFPKIITGEFGADRMDYLRRDAYFCGTSYGFFDYSRLLENILLVDGRKCVHISALRSLESFILGRYFMYSQVYFHKVVRILNIHLKEIIENFFKEGLLDPMDFHRKTDHHIISLMLDRHKEERVRRVLGREHYREVFFTSSREVFEFVKERLLEKYGEELLRFDHISKKVLDEDIPLWDGNKMVSLMEASRLVSSLKDMRTIR